MRFYANSAYWTENIVGLLQQHALHPVIPPKSNALLGTPLLGPIVLAHRLYPGFYRPNHHPEYRSSVEHAFVLFSSNSPFHQYLIVYLPLSSIPFTAFYSVTTIDCSSNTPNKREKNFWTCLNKKDLSLRLIVMNKN